MTSQPTFIDLFAGIGGNHTAFENHGWVNVFTSEWDRHAATVLQNNYQVEVAGDITKIDPDSIPDHTLISAGFPCQAFSISGRRLGFEDTRGTLFFNVAAIAKAKQPPFLLLENVRNFAQHDNGRTIAVVQQTLEELGYRFSWRLFNASNFGVPQNRQRVFMMAVREDIADGEDFHWPTPPNPTVTLNDILLPAEEVTDYIIDRADITLNSTAIQNATPANSPIRVGTVGKGGQGERIYHPAGHAITLSAYGGGVGAKTGLYLTEGVGGEPVVRKLAPRECARLLGFPDTFQPPASKTQAWKQFGNSVAVPVVEAIVKNINTQYADQL